MKNTLVAKSVCPLYYQTIFKISASTINAAAANLVNFSNVPSMERLRFFPQ